MKIQSLITHPHVVPNPQDLCSASEHKLTYFGQISFDNIVSGSGNISVTLLSMQGQKALGFHQKYLNLYSEDD